MPDSENTTSPSRSRTRLSHHGEADDDKDTGEVSKPDQDVHLSFLSYESDEEGDVYITDMEEEMKQEKKRYPGASSWAPAEERLFEILFMRQDLPMLPTTWDVDLRGIPISETIFRTSEDFPPIIYAHGKNFAGKLIPDLEDIWLTTTSNTMSDSTCRSYLKD